MDNAIKPEDLFDQHAVQYEDKFMDVSDYSVSLKALLGFVTEPEARLLDLGCGPGNIVKYLLESEQGLQILGVDLAPKMIVRARKNNPSAEFQVMDCRDILQLQRKFDVIVGGFCLPYLNEIETAKLVRDASKMLEKDGVIYLSTMEASENHITGLQSSPNSNFSMLINYHSYDFLAKELENSGYKIEYERRQENTDQNGVAGIDLIFIARNIGKN